MAKFIECKEIPGLTWQGKPMYAVLNKRSGDVLARLCWYREWKQWIADFREGSIWSQDCLADVRAFLQQLNAGGNPQSSIVNRQSSMDPAPPGAKRPAETPAMRETSPERERRARGAV